MVSLLYPQIDAIAIRLRFYNNHTFAFQTAFNHLCNHNYFPTYMKERGNYRGFRVLWGAVHSFRFFIYSDLP